jgi:heme-degrading monooxygenase HmoA
MHARVSRYRAKDDAENVAERVRARVEQEFYPRYLVDAPGFRGYFVVDLGDQDGGHELVSFSLWDDPAAADRNVAQAERFVRDSLADLLDATLQSATGEVFFAR